MRRASRRGSDICKGRIEGRKGLTGGRGGTKRTGITAAREDKEEIRSDISKRREEEKEEDKEDTTRDR